MYKEEYKKKYLKFIKNRGLDEFIPDDITDVISNESEEIENIIKSYEIKSKIFHDETQTIIDIGLYGKARGKIYEENDFDTSLFIKLENTPSISKILLIDNTADFDEFTSQYGKINKKDNNIYISWDIVAKKYKGFYLKSVAINNREEDIPYNGKTIKSWIYNDFKNIDKIIIFKKIIIPNIKLKTITKPFKAKIVDSYSIKEDEFLKITDPIIHSGILFIDNIKSFDKFTNKYGSILKSDIIINWIQVAKDYDGFCIDKNNNFEKDRYEKAFYENKLFTSWWNLSKLIAGMIYIFE